MDKRVYILVGLLALGGLGYYLSQPKCQKADDVQLRVAQMACAQALDTTLLKKKACLKLKGVEDCQLYREEDGEAVEAFVIQEIQPCVDKEFKAQNLCVESK